MADEVQNLILNIKGDVELKRLNAEIAKEEEAIRKLVQQLGLGTISQGHFDAAAATSAREIMKLRGEIEALAGKGGLTGGGILQASYAVQDFTSVLSGGQGLARALSAVQNNIPGLLMSLGVSGGLAGVVSLVSVGIGALIPVVEQLWTKLGDKEAAEAAKQRLKELREEIKAAHDEFERLAKAPTDYERQSAQLTREFLEDRPNAEKLRAGLVATMGAKSGVAGLSAEQREEYNRAARSVLSDEQIAARAEASASEAAIRTRSPEAVAAARERTATRLRAAREAAEDRRRKLLESGKAQQAERLVRDALRAGPEGDAARGELERRIQEEPGFFPPNFLQHLHELGPEALRQQQEEIEAAEEEGKQAIERGRRRRAKEAARDRTSLALERQGRANKEAGDERERRDEEQEVRDAERADAENLHEFRKARAAAPVRRARAQVTRAARQMGYGTPTDAQAEEMARDVVSLTRQGVATNDAILSAVRSKAQEIERLQARLMTQRAEAMRLQMGADQSGQFSLLPPMW